MIERGPAARWGLDLTVCAALVAFGVSVSTRSDLANGTFVDTLLLPVAVLPILLRHREPLLAAVALVAGAVLSGLPTFDQFRLALIVPAGMLILYSVAEHTARRDALVGLACGLAAMVFVGLTDPVLRHGNGGLAAMVVFSFPLCLLSWAAGRVAQSRERLAAELAERLQLLDRRRERTAELAVAVERERLAADLDLAARGRVRDMIAIATRADSLLATELTEAFTRIERLGRESLNEMRALLGVLRSDERGARSPRPTLTELEALLREAQAGGEMVELELIGDRRALPAGVELAAYRALQHALFALRAGAGGRLDVLVRYGSDRLELEVRGAVDRGPEAEGALRAARERILAYGGAFAAEVGAAGQIVRATLPIEANHA